MRRSFPLLVVACALVTVLFQACTPEPPDCTRPDVFCVGLLMDAEIADNEAFNQPAWEGIQQARASGIADWIQYLENTDPLDYSRNLSVFGDAGFDVIVTVGDDNAGPTREAAAVYQDTFFIGVDQYQDITVSNVSGLVFPEDQAGFLAGSLAAMMSQTGMVGAVCGTDKLPSYWRYCEGYRAGASYVSSEIEVLIAYHNDVDPLDSLMDPEWGAVTANSMVSGGADVIFGAGGKTGNGAVIEAAQRGVYGIGANTDQYTSLPEARSRLLSSAVNQVSSGVEELVAAANSAGSGAAAFPAGNYMGQVTLAPFHDLDSLIPGDVRQRLDAIQMGLMDGSIWTGVLPASNPLP